MFSSRALQRQLPRMFRFTSTMVNPPGQKIEVNGINIHYEKFGNGDHVVLLLPGLCGTTRTDFDSQLKYMGKNALTIVAWDPPGHGFSRPPDRVQISRNVFHEDAKVASELMQKLGCQSYSLLGWSSGAITALIMAGNNPKTIRKMALLACRAYLTDHDMKAVYTLEDINNWKGNALQHMLIVYEKYYMQTLCSAYAKVYKEVYEHGHFVSKEELSRIKCPTLIIHGEKDYSLSKEHPTYLHDNIKGSKVALIPEGTHNFHVQNHQKFNKMVEEFLLH